jgi:hypothetical protein
MSPWCRWQACRRRDIHTHCSGCEVITDGRQICGLCGMELEGQRVHADDEAMLSFVAILFRSLVVADERALIRLT